MRKFYTLSWLGLGGCVLALAACSSAGSGVGPNGTALSGPEDEAETPEPIIDPSLLGPSDCSAPPPLGELSGWASDGMGTTGGGDATPMLVTSADAFRSAIAGVEPRVVYLQGMVDGRFEIGSNKTVAGVCGAQISGHVRFNGSSNSILRNLKVVGRNCTDSPMDCSGGADAITLSNGAHHIWVDHLDISDGSDGNLDVTQGSDFVTISWTKFSYSTRRIDPEAGATGHRFSNLVGSSDNDPADPGHLNVTFHHSWWADNVDQRMPRTRRGQIHVFNNLYTAAGNSYCTDAGFEAKLLVQNNVYVNVNRPFEVRDGGNMRSDGNVLRNALDVLNPMGTGFAPPYAFALDATTDLEARLRGGVGPH